MSNLQKIDNQQSKYDEIIEYLSQDKSYWLKNDKWDTAEKIFLSRVVDQRYINFIDLYNLKNEVKFYVLFNFKNKFLSECSLTKTLRPLSLFKEFRALYLNNIKTFNDLDIDKINKKWSLFLINRGFKVNKTGGIKESVYYCFINNIYNFIKDFYDDREETEKDIWYSKNITGVKISATSDRIASSISFIEIPLYYREVVKRYFRTIITKRSWAHCFQVLNKLKFFFNYFYSNNYEDGFIKNLNRNDIEKYLFFIGNERKGKNPTETSKYISYIRTFLEYIQMAQYDKAPKKEISFLIFQDDIPKRERPQDYMRRTKFVPEPILKQLDNNIRDLDRPQFIPVYILLRETGWRGTDILNLRYNNCLEQIWNNKNQNYNYYLCGEITKTGIAQLKIPIRDRVADMVKKSIDKAKSLSTEENNPKKYLFNTYEGKLKGTPLAKQSLLLTINRLIKEKDIRDVNGELYHFKLHSLRHTRAKEYVEQGIGISIIQQILGHQSLQMTVHYATVSENVLYEKWKNTEDLELFKVNTETNELTAIDTSTDVGKSLVRYEYVKKNLDAVRVPFGVCFKPSKLPCKQQMNHCLTCASFCTTTENIPEYEEEIEKVKSQIEISNRCGRELWAEKNKQYLNVLEQTLQKIKEQKVVHKNGKSREDS